MQPYFNENGVAGWFPWGADAARRAKKGVYSSLAGCDICGQRGYITRYVRDDSCRNCLQTAWAKAFQEVTRAPGEHMLSVPTSPAAAMSEGLTYWYKDDYALCEKNPHPKARHVDHGRCVACTGEKDGHQRQYAKDHADDHYNSTFPCVKCNFERYWTDTGKCATCHPRVKKSPNMSASRVFMEASPDAIVSREMATLMGIKVFRDGSQCRRGHDGFRRLNGQCLGCINGEPSRPVNETTAPSGMKRTEATKSGYRLYNTGTPCQRGHTGPRYTSTGNCKECLK